MAAGDESGLLDEAAAALVLIDPQDPQALAALAAQLDGLRPSPGAPEGTQQALAQAREAARAMRAPGADVPLHLKRTGRRQLKVGSQFGSPACRKSDGWKSIGGRIGRAFGPVAQKEYR